MLLCPRNLPGRNTGASCHFLLQGIFLTQEINPCLPHLLCLLQCRQILFLLCHRGSKTSNIILCFFHSKCSSFGHWELFMFVPASFDKLPALWNYCFLFSHFLAQKEKLRFHLVSLLSHFSKGFAFQYWRTTLETKIWLFLLLLGV